MSSLAAQSRFQVDPAIHRLQDDARARYDWLVAAGALHDEPVRSFEPVRVTFEAAVRVRSEGPGDRYHSAFADVAASLIAQMVSEMRRGVDPYDWTVVGETDGDVCFALTRVVTFRWVPA